MRPAATRSPAAVFSTPYQYTEAELRAAVRGSRARVGKRVAVHATGEPGTLYAARAGVASIDHAYQLSDETMRLMREKQIFAVPTFTISEYFAEHAPTRGAAGARESAMLAYHARGVPQAAGRGRARRHGLRRRPVPARHAGARVCADGEVRHDAAGRAPGRHAERRQAARLAGPDRRAASPATWPTSSPFPATRCDDIAALQKVAFVMKGGVVYKR